MVIKKDPRAVLELLSQPVPVDEDTEFLDNLAKKTSFHDMPDKPAEELNVDPKMNEEQEAMLRDLADVEVDDEEYNKLEQPQQAAEQQPPQEMSKKKRSFFALFQGVRSKDNVQGDVPDNIDFKAISATTEQQELPQVGDTEEEKIAKQEDLERRQAYLEWQAKQEAMGKKASDLYEKSHDKFLANFDQVKNKH